MTTGGTAPSGRKRSDSPLPGPRWAVDPADHGRLRYWDGSEWTGFTSPRPTAPTTVTWGPRWRTAGWTLLGLVLLLATLAGGTSGGWTGQNLDPSGCPLSQTWNGVSSVLWCLAGLLAVVGAAVAIRRRRLVGTTDWRAVSCVVVAAVAAVVVPGVVYVMGFNACWA